MVLGMVGWVKCGVKIRRVMFVVYGPTWLTTEAISQGRRKNKVLLYNGDG